MTNTDRILRALRLQDVDTLRGLVEMATPTLLRDTLRVLEDGANHEWADILMQTYMEQQQ